MRAAFAWQTPKADDKYYRGPIGHCTAQEFSLVKNTGAGEGTVQSAAHSHNCDTWLNLMIKWISASHIECFIDGDEMDVTTGLETWTSGYHGLGCEWGSYWDDYRVRKYADPEPGATVGSEEAAEATSLYRSVGISATDLNTNTRSVEISGSTATFNGAMPTNVGVGDVLQYTVDSTYYVAFIHGRTSDMVYTVKSSSAGTPEAASSGTDVQVYRAYTCLANWESQTENSTIHNDVENFDTSTDLVSDDTIMNAACYGDGVDTTVVEINGWTTGADNYIKIYTPYQTSQVGTSQRHSGVWDTGKYRIVIANAHKVLDIFEENVRIEGLQIFMDGIDSGMGDGYAIFMESMTGTVDIRISSNIVKSTAQATYPANGFVGSDMGANSIVRIWNNLIYDLGQTSGDYASAGIWQYTIDGNSTYYVYNNTVINAYYGFRPDPNQTDFIVINNIAQDCNTGFFEDFGSWSGDCDYNLSDLAADAPGTNSRNSTTVTFVNELGDNFHLASIDTGAKDYGTDLSSDPNLDFSDDIDGATRPENSIWDIGADETTTISVARDLYRSVGTSSTNLNTDNRTVTISDSTATFSNTMPDSIGVGDVLEYEIGTGYHLAFIHGRSSDTAYTVKSNSGENPKSASSATCRVYRAYNCLDDWEDQQEAQVNSTIKDAVDEYVLLPTTDLAANNTVANVACYGDGADTTMVEIDGWTTDSDNYIRIYTPTSTSEVGTTQRHSGKWNTGKYRLTPNNSGYSLIVYEAYTKIDGLQIGTTYSNPMSYGIFYIAENASGYQLSNSIIDGNNVAPAGIYTSSGLSSYDFKVWNTIIYDTTDCGIWDNWSGGTIYIYNCSIYNCGFGIRQTDGTITVKNTIAQNCNDGFYDEGGGGWGTSDYNLSDLADDAPGTNSRNLTDVTFVSTSTDDFHLHANDTGAKNYGTDLSSDSNLSFSDDIDGDTRPYFTTWDIGADECTESGAINLYRSVGISSSDLNTDNRTVEISGSTATFNGTMPTNVGVGDVLQYTVDSTYYVAFIHGRTSDTVYTVKSSSAGTPEAASAGTDCQVYRAYTALSNWQDQDENDTLNGTVENFDTSTDLVSDNTVMNAACYADGPDTVGEGQIALGTGWTTGADNYMRVFTPTSTSEVGTSQRHNGTAGSGYKLVHTVWEAPIYIRTSHVRIEGLEIDMTGSTHSSRTHSIEMQAASINNGDIRISDNLLHGGNAANAYSSGITIREDDGTGNINVRIWNNIIYDISQELGISMSHLGSSNSGTVYIYNNTLVDCNMGINGHDTVNVIAKNNLVKGSGDTYTYDGTFAAGTDYNATDSTDNIGQGSNNRTSQTVTFVNEPGDDFHLASIDTGAKDYGTDLSSDPNLSFSDDIDGDTRPENSVWDIGADETTTISVARDLYRSVGTSSTNLNTDNRTVTISDSTATFSNTMPDSIGVGDVLEYEIGTGYHLAFIHGRNSDTAYTVKSNSGENPKSASSATCRVYRAYNCLDDWEDQQEAQVNPSIKDAVDDYVLLPTTDLAGNNTVVNLACYGDGADTTAVTINGWTTGTDNYIKIYTPTATSEVGTTQRHNGKWDDGKYVIERTTTSDGQATLEVTEDYVRIEGLQVKITSGWGGCYAIMINGQGASNDIRISDNVVVGVLTEGDIGVTGIYLYDSDGIFRVWNNIVYDFMSTYKATGIGSRGNTVYAYNNTVFNCRWGFYHYATTFVVKNNITQDCTDGFIIEATAFDSSSDYNLSDLADDAPGTNSRNAVDVTFVSTSTGDFHLDANDTGAKNYGTDLSSDGNLSFSDDIDGDTRPYFTTWDIGADESTEAAVEEGQVIMIW